MRGGSKPAGGGQHWEIIEHDFGFSGMLQIEHYLRSFVVCEVYMGCIRYKGCVFTDICNVFGAHICNLVHFFLHIFEWKAYFHIQKNEDIHIRMYNYVYT